MLTRLEYVLRCLVVKVVPSPVNPAGIPILELAPQLIGCDWVPVTLLPGEPVQIVRPVPIQTNGRLSRVDTIRMCGRVAAAGEGWATIELAQLGAAGDIEVGDVAVINALLLA